MQRNGECCVKNVVAPSLVRSNIDSLVVLVSRKFPCLLEIDLLFILNFKWGTKLAKTYSTSNAMFIPTYNQKNKRTCQKVEKRMNEKRMRSYLFGLRINSTLIFMSSSSYHVRAIS